VRIAAPIKPLGIARAAASPNAVHGAAPDLSPSAGYWSRSGERLP